MPCGTILFGKENALVNNVYVLMGQASEGDIETDDGYDSSDSSQGRNLLTVLLYLVQKIFLDTSIISSSRTYSPDFNGPFIMSV